MPLPRQRRSAAMYVQISSSGVTSVVTGAAGTRPLATGTHDTDGTAKEKTAKRISRQVLHRRLRRLGRKLDGASVMFRGVAGAARIEGKGGRGRQKRGARAGQNARRRLRGHGKGGRFMASPGGEEVEDSHPGPDFTTTTTTTDSEDQERHQVVVVGGGSKMTKKRRQRERGGNEREHAEVAQRELRMRAETAEGQAAQMKTQLQLAQLQAQAELQEHTEYADGEVAAARAEGEAQAAEMKARLRAVQDAKTIAVQPMERKAVEAQAAWEDEFERTYKYASAARPI